MQSVFGAARPRETIIAARVGKTEEEILKEEVQKEKIKVREHVPPGFCLSALAGAHAPESLACSCA